MSKEYSEPPAEVLELVASRRRKHYTELDEYKVTITTFMVTSSDGHALKLHGNPCFAIMRKTSQKERAHGTADAELSIDLEKWENLTPAQREALIDHELHHLIVVKDRNDDSKAKKDPQGRPVLAIRPHDFEFGLFAEVAARHGRDSIEVAHVKLMWDQNKEELFPFLDTTQLTLF